MGERYFFDGQEMNPHSKKSTKGKEVYHYTSPDSFISIFNNKKLWFSDSQFLNDRSEYIHIKNIFKEAVESTSLKDADAGFVNYLMGTDYEGFTLKHKPRRKNVLKTGFSFLRTRYYLLCASVNSDTHNLWSYYVKNNKYQGCNIGLSIDSLIESISKPEWKIRYGLVNYDRDMQIVQLHDKINELDKKYAMKDDMDDLSKNIAIEYFQEELSEYLLERCLFYKNPAFEHEKEYRFVIEVPTEEDSNIIDYHVGNSGLIVPHLQVGFDPDKIVKNITLAPMMEQDVAKLGIQQLLKYKCKMKSDIKINFSQIDVRF